ncbi:sulfatase [Halosegnis rubeus]|uniref:Sulfatase-like hydrolase/transferase n=1 Tax=Halosegnis rubeus TaxID=2212850 RepID=A0A5N5UH34_9EURY|nr:sulfatase [Halosegnis rubeus]KAB7517978.1 sulfatase-like hydrolase/transferase [Halosegnis rubeus]
MSANRPNIVLVVLDTARFDEVMTCVNDIQTTPFLQTLANEGATYTTAFSPAPWTLPSHASLFTGTYPSRHGAHAGHKQLNHSIPTLTEAFAANDYETVGVSNNTWISGEFGFERGFETFHRTWQYVQSDTDLGRAARTNEGVTKYRAVVKALIDGNPLTNLLNAFYGKFLRKQHDKGAIQTNDWIESWLSDRNDDPFFLFVNYLEPHLEYRPPSEHAKQFLPDGISYDEAMEIPQDAWRYIAKKTVLSDDELDSLRALYRAEIAYLDERLRELRSILQKSNEWKNTIFVVLGDHGENIGEFGLMDHQYSLADTLLHVPLVIHGGPFNNYGQIDSPVQLVDIPATLLECAGIDQSIFNKSIQGQSFHPDSDMRRSRVFAEYLAPQPSMEALEQRVGKLPAGVRTYDRSLRTIRTDEWKLIRGSDGTRRLYRTEGEETDDKSELYPDIAEHLENQLDEWLNSFEHADVTDDAVRISKDTRNRLEELGYLQ